MRPRLLAAGIALTGIFTAIVAVLAFRHRNGGEEPLADAAPPTEAAPVAAAEAAEAPAPPTPPAPTLRAGTPPRGGTAPGDGRATP